MHAMSSRKPEEQQMRPGIMWNRGNLFQEVIEEARYAYVMAE